ncbi:hypothetical protein BFJ69_g511 [Fusarium oxysporum]|uniref:Peptidase A1 domain-containing protein n=1 Tax=Fusarium oxysporum TaxID=5507 RepID=A0A420P5G6_FUSOX|nr:hypothetical protein BFJ69_g511 [Fusarium oxysporum]
MLATLITLTLALIATISAEVTPREVKWTDDTFGPDGPWRAVSIRMGNEESSIGLYPGSAWESWLIQDRYCRKGTCFASKAGTYDNSSGTQGGIQMPADLSGFMLGLDLKGNPATRHLDRMWLNGAIVENVSLALLESQKIKYPGGQTSPFFAGCLSLGGRRAINQSFSQDDGPAINASLVPGWMWEHEWTRSSSFGMHIGSVQPDISGSLWFGGYDQNRVIGEVLNMNGGPRDGITLRDIAIDVIGTKSPFEFNSKDGLLANGNSSIGGSLKVLVDGCSPYFTLPRSTCDSIAAHLPVRFNKDLGLYIWDTKSDRYKEIINSASALSFSFISNSNTDPIKIRVPFMHLNLTLSAPLSDKPTPYFPCHSNGKDQYVLGRAFLQDAFVGANWHPDIDTWWLAQAPGPNIQATPNVVSIGEKDKTVSKGGNDWKVSWSGVWDDQQAPSSTPTADSTDKKGDTKGNEEGSKEDDQEDDKVGMSVGAKAGIGAGIAAAVIAAGVGVFLCWRRRRNQPQEESTTEPVATVDESKLPSVVLYPQELPSQEVQPPYYQRFELPS